MQIEQAIERARKLMAMAAPDSGAPVAELEANVGERNDV
jgi:hypothetical protein